MLAIFTPGGRFCIFPLIRIKFIATLYNVIYKAVNGMEHVERFFPSGERSCPKAKKKIFTKIQISRLVFGVRQTIEYLGVSTHRCGPVGALYSKIWVRYTHSISILGVLMLPIPLSNRIIIWVCWGSCGRSKWSGGVKKCWKLQTECNNRTVSMRRYS